MPFASRLGLSGGAMAPAHNPLLKYAVLQIPCCITTSRRPGRRLLAGAVLLKNAGYTEILGVCLLAVGTNLRIIIIANPYLFVKLF